MPQSEPQQSAICPISVVLPAKNEAAASLGARVVRHPYSMGNGAAVKAGARATREKVLVFMDADGQHDPDDIPRLRACQ